MTALLGDLGVADPADLSAVDATYRELGFVVLRGLLDEAAVAEVEAQCVAAQEDVAAGRYRSRTAWPTGSVQDGFDGISTWYLGRSGIAYTLGGIDSALVSADEAYRVSRA